MGGEASEMKDDYSNDLSLVVSGFFVMWRMGKKQIARADKVHQIPKNY